MTSRQDFPANRFPFSDEICLFMDNHPEFKNSLKIVNPNRFKYISLIFTSHTPPTHPFSNDQVIGMWYIDAINFRLSRFPLFKQDFIVNKDSNNIEFISYTTRPIVRRANSPFVQPIQDFFRIYGQNGLFYHNNQRWAHHYDNITDLPNEPRLRLMARSLINTL